MRRREKWKVGAFECEWHKSQARPHSTANCAAPACAPPRAPTPRRHCIDLQPRRGEEARPPPPTTLFNSRALGQFFSDDSCLPAVYITTPSSLTTLVCTLHPYPSSYRTATIGICGTKKKLGVCSTPLNILSWRLAKKLGSWLHPLLFEFWACK
jgi:hypothetical protein